MFLAVAHVILNLTLCASMTKIPHGTPIAAHVKMIDRTGDADVDVPVNLQNITAEQATAEFDPPRGVFRLEVTVPKYNCSTSDFLAILPDHVRTIAEALEPGPPPPPMPVFLFDGDAPVSFSYARPTFVMFDATQACNTPIGTPLKSDLVLEQDPLGFYVWVYPDPVSTAAGKVVVALRLRTPTGLYHYIRIPIPFPAPWQGFPGNVHFTVTGDTLTDMATEKTDTLLCPKLQMTSAH